MIIDIDNNILTGVALVKTVKKLCGVTFRTPGTNKKHQ
jgi:hypothetical protein